MHLLYGFLHQKINVMNLLKKFIIGLSLITSFAQAQVGLENIIVEKDYISDTNDAVAHGGRLPAGSVTYRIYVDMLPGYAFQAAFGLPEHELRIATTTSFFNNEDKGAIIANLIQRPSLEKNTLILDSWLSVGAASEGNFGILKSDDDGVNTIANIGGFLKNADPIAGIPIKTQDGLISGKPQRVSFFGIDSIVKVFLNDQNNILNGNTLSTTSGSWLCLKGATGPTADNRVLIAQLTTNGVFSFELNIQIGTPDGAVQKYVAKNPTGTELQHPALIYSTLPIRKLNKINSKKTKGQ